MSKSNSFRVGKVSGYLRGRVWYLYYFENGKRRRPRAGAERDVARQLAAQVNSQLETGAPSALSFEPIGVPALRDRWLEHHEQVRRSSVQSIARYRTATDHLLRYLAEHPVRHAGQFTAAHAAAFVCHLRALRVSPNGHANTPKRPLLDKGVRYVLECCRALFNHAAKRRHLPPYADNPFTAIEVDRIPVETARPVELLTPAQERAFLGACDEWQFPVFLTLLLTGLRPGELCHLLLPDDLDLDAGVVRVRNKPRLGWQVKTRNQRDVPLVPALADVLRVHLAVRTCGPVFRRRTWTDDRLGFDVSSTAVLERELSHRLVEEDATRGAPDRGARLRLARRLWRDIGAVGENWIRVEFMPPTAPVPVPVGAVTRLLGEVIAWACPGVSVTHSDLVRALEDADLDPGVARELAPRHAFSRACKRLSDQRIIRPVSEDTAAVKFQFTQESREGDRYEYRLETTLTLDKQTGAVTCELPGLAAMAQEELDRCIAARTGSDVTRVIQKLFERNADLFLIRPQGGCYFCPACHAAFVDKIQVLLNRVGGRLLRFPVPAGTAEGDRSVTQAVADGLAAAVAEHRAAVAQFGTDTRADTLGRAAERIRTTKFKLQTYAEYLVGEKERLDRAVADAEGELRAKVAEIAAEPAVV